MAVYLIANLQVHDLELHAEYRRLVPPLIAKHGGEYLVRGGAIEVIEGSWQLDRLVVLRFPTREAFRAFYDDPDYAPLLAMRQRASTTDMIVADGVDAGA